MLAAILRTLVQHLSSPAVVRFETDTTLTAIFNASLTESATVGIVIPDISPDYPSILHFGPVYFEGYHTWPDTKFVHGFNLGRNSTEARKALIDSVPYACKALKDNLLNWELGNEPDLFTRPGGPRPPSWDEQDYVDQWVYYTRQIRDKMRQACPEMASGEEYKYYAPSFAGTGGNALNLVTTWADGLDKDKIIAIDSSHNYISGADVPGVTLQHTLMNHTANVASVAQHLNETRHLRALDDSLWPNLPYIMGETNSLYHQGRPGLSNTFGATLWGVDFNLWCATNNISRVHMHQGTNYRYQAWQPIQTNLTALGTKAPYYGSIAVAAFLGDIPAHTPRITNFPLASPYEAAYGAYVDDALAKIMVINLQEYNATEGNNMTNDYPRPVERYAFQLPEKYAGQEVGVQRLMANGSDAITGVTFDGWSFNWELDEGRPVRLGNVTVGESVSVDKKGVVSVDVDRSSAVILRFGGGEGEDCWEGR